MTCDDLKEQIYEWSKGTLSPKNRSALEAHLQNCQNCQSYAEEVKQTISLLDAVKPPPLSPGFKEKVLLRSQAVPLPSRLLGDRIREWFRIPYIKWPLEGLAATAVILIALTLYKDLNPTKPSRPELTPRSFPIEISETTARYPIILQTKEFEKTLAALEITVKKFDGRNIQSLPRDQKILVSFSLKKENEAAFLSQLEKLGLVQMKQDGFRDDDGNMVVVLKR